MIRYALAFGALFAAPAFAHDDVYRIQITRIVDGDTAEARVDLGFGFSVIETLRFSCIDTPEVRGETSAEGKRVTGIVAGWIADTQGMAQIEGRGRFGRLITVYTPDGWRGSFNRRALDEGLAVVEAYDDAHRAQCVEME